MGAIRVETVVESDGVVHITDLPYVKGDRVEAVIALHSEPKEREREAARQRLLERAAVAASFLRDLPHARRAA